MTPCPNYEKIDGCPCRHCNGQCLCFRPETVEELRDGPIVLGALAKERLAKLGIFPLGQGRSR